MLISVESCKLMVVKMMDKYLCCMFASVWFIVVCFLLLGEFFLKSTAFLGCYMLHVTCYIFDF